MDNSTQAPSQPILLNSTLSLPSSVSKTLSSKIENLIKYSYVPKDAQISETQSPLLSLIIYSEDKDLHSDLSLDSSPQKDPMSRSMSNLPEWTNVLWLPPLKNNMSTLRSSRI